MHLPYRKVTSDHYKYTLFQFIRGMLGFTCLVSSLIDFKGSYRIARYARKWIPGPEEINIVLDDDVVIAFPKTDPYWLRLLCKSYIYETELLYILEKLRNKNYVFVDVGANIGYWSVLASSKRFGSKRAIAIEPVSSNIKWISRNCELNQRRFVYLHGALHWESIDEVFIYAGTSESPTRPGASVIREDGDKAIEKSKVYRFKDIASKFSLYKHILLVKLDVEGIERFIAEDIYCQCENVLIIYEDHGKDYDCSNTSWFLKRFGFVWYIDKKGNFIKVKDIDHVRAIKQKRTIGYNFLSGPRGLLERMLELNC